MFTRAEIKAQAKEQLKGNVGAFFLCLLAYIGVAIVIALISGLISQAIPAVGTILVYVITPPLLLGYYIVYLNATYGDKPQVVTLFEGYRNYFGKSIILYFLIFIFTILWTLLFIIPGIIKALSYSMAYYVMADNPDMKASEALNESKEIMKGHKMDLFVLYLSFIPWILLVYVTLGIAGIWVIPYMQLTLTNFYQNIKRQPVAEEAVYEEAAYEAPYVETVEDIVE